MSSLSGVWDWDFFWGNFGFLLKSVSAFPMIVIAIICVGLLLSVVIKAVRNRD